MNPEYDPNRALDAQALRITEEEMTSLVTSHHARRLTEEGGWLVSWLPGRVLTRNQAITAMVLAATVAVETLHCENPMWEHIDQWAAELELTGPYAVVLAGEPLDEDPGPLPEVVEPDGTRRITTVAASPNVRVSVIDNVGHTGRVGLSLMTATGEMITAALDSAAVDVLLEALAAAVPVQYVPQLPEVAVYRPSANKGGEA